MALIDKLFTNEIASFQGEDASSNLVGSINSAVMKWYHDWLLISSSWFESKRRSLTILLKDLNYDLAYVISKGIIMPTCKNCNTTFKNKIEIDGKIRNLQKRKFCLDCSPFNQHNTSSILDPDERLKRRRTQWVKGVINWRRRKKLLLIEYKGKKCQQCGYDKPIPGAYAFHHRDPIEKDLAISGSSLSLARLKKEVDKCDLLCVRCHAEVHHKLERNKSWK